jgi:hypothetical protein
MHLPQPDLVFVPCISNARDSSTWLSSAITRQGKRVIRKEVTVQLSSLLFRWNCADYCALDASLKLGQTDRTTFRAPPQLRLGFG